ncbi:MAG TPA: hypothetical protein VGB82_26705 [Alphaproteobacteria bacterium]
MSASERRPGAIPLLPTKQDRDRPLTFRWAARDRDWSDALGLPAARRRNLAAARSAVLLSAIKAAAAGAKYISYSRNHNFYDDAHRRYQGPTFTHANITGAVDQLAGAGLLESQVSKRGELGRQSRFRATAKLIDIAPDVPAVCMPHELIRLKDTSGRLIDYLDTEETCRMRREIAAINEALADITVELLHGGAVRQGPVIRLEDAILYPEMMSLWRVFGRGTFARHGRMYGGWWQNVPKDARQSLRIEGEAVSEPDYRAHHCRICYVLAGLPEPNGDPHLISGWDTPAGRELCKSAFNILINAVTPQKALAALAKKIEGCKYVRAASREMATAAIDAVRQRHEPIASFFANDSAMTLMRFDSEIAVQVVRKLLRRGIVALPIHDSFIVQQRHGGELRAAMDDAWATFRSGQIATAHQGYNGKASYRWVPSLAPTCPPGRPPYTVPGRAAWRPVSASIFQRRSSRKKFVTPASAAACRRDAP